MTNTETHRPTRLLICGASVRAASQSASRAGYQVLAADLFCDRDLGAITEAFQIQDYPSGFAALRAAFRDVPVMYTGALENYPALLDDFGREGVLLGNTAPIVRRVRDPVLLHRVQRASGIRAPETRLYPPKSHQMTWLNKPLRSAGGNRVRRWNEGDASLADGYFQQHIDGTVRAGSFLACREGCRLVGVSDTYVGCDWTGAQRFAYSGSVTHHPDAHERQKWQEIGNVLATRFGLIGLFGVDAIVSDGVVWPIEVNPRYTASMELFESGSPLVGAHIKACLNEIVPEPDLAPALDPARQSDAVGKAILYAPRKVRLPAVLEIPSRVSDAWLADIPQSETVVEPRHPIVTVLARGTDKSDIERKLRAACGYLLRLLTTSTC